MDDLNQSWVESIQLTGYSVIDLDKKYPDDNDTFPIGWMRTHHF
jgi:hypothetical protein